MFLCLLVGLIVCGGSVVMAVLGFVDDLNIWY